MQFLENPLRIKITGRCNRDCSFCHEEGGMDGIDDLAYTEQLGYIINTLHDNLGIDSIAFTGGEPLFDTNLDDIISQISMSTKICKFSLTTNGTISKDYEYWLRLYNLGLYKVNISMPDIMSTDDLPNNDCINDVFAIQSKTISILNKIGIETKINIVVFNDVLFTKNTLAKLLYFRDTLNSELVLLPNLNSPKDFNYSQKVINTVRNDMRLRKVSEKRRVGTSNAIEKYCDADDEENGNVIFIKSTKMQDGNPYRLDSLCGQCSKRTPCQEGFYGIRLEQRDDNYYIRLCIHKSSSDVLMKFQDFMESNVYKEIKTLWEIKS